MRAPFATWRGSPNVGGNLIRPAKGLVVHVEVGTEAGTTSCFQNPRFQASAHFGCANDGSLDQFVDTDAVAWAEVAGNPGWISVETEGDPSTPLTDAQVASIGRLFQWLRGLYGFPSQTCDHDGTGLTTHAHYPSGIADPSWGGHPCPGPLRSAQLPAILAAAGGATQGDTDMAYFGPNGANQLQQINDARLVKVREWWLAYRGGAEFSPAQQQACMNTWAQKGGDATLAAIKDGTIQ